MKVLAQLALKGPGQAIGLIVALAMLGLMVPPVALFSAAVMALVCLQADSRLAVLVLGGSAALASILGGLLAAMPLLGVALTVVIWLPAAAAAMWLRRSGSLPQALTMSAVLGASVVVMLDGAMADFQQTWQNLITDQMGALSEGLSTEDGAQLQSNLEAIAPLLPGILGMSVMLSLQIALLLARWMQSMVLKAGAFGAEFRALKLGQVSALVVAAVITAALFVKAPLWQSLALVVGWLPVLQGIALMHSFCGREGFSQGKPLLVLGWVLLIVLPHFVVLLAALGAVDNWLDFRRRWAPEANQ